MTTDAQQFRERITRLFGRGAQSALSRAMIKLGDPRNPRAVLLSISRMATGTHGVSGEMWCLLSLLERLSQAERDSLARAA